MAATVLLVGLSGAASVVEEDRNEPGAMECLDEGSNGGGALLDWSVLDNPDTEVENERPGGNEGGTSLFLPAGSGGASELTFTRALELGVVGSGGEVGGIRPAGNGGGALLALVADGTGSYLPAGIGGDSAPDLLGSVGGGG